MKKTALFFAAILCLAACKKNLPVSISEPTQPGGKPSTATMSLVSDMNPFTVMSFNIRITYPEDQYTQSERKTYILQVILDNNPDIFCIQELAEDSMETYFNTQLAAAGYGVYNSGLANGSPKSIFYKNARFARTNAGWFTMHTPDYRSGKWAVLQDKLNTSNSYFVVNSHWTTLSAAQRSMDCDTVLDAISAHNTSNLPVICVGDFNAQPGAAEISKLKNGLSCVDALFDDQGDPTFHGWDAVGDAKIDWLMSTRDLAFTSSSVITTSFTVNGGTLWPSDHWPVKATYVPSVFGGAHADANGKSANASTEFYFADVDGDGKKDKIYWNSTYDSGKPQVFLSNGNGTFAAAGIAHTAGASTLTTTRHYYADVNGDGKADEILWDPNVSSGQTRVFLATGSGNFSSTAINNTEGTSQGTTTQFNFADVNGDGKADKIYWNATYDNGHTRVYLATSGGSFSSTVVSGAEGASTTAGTLFYYADVNGDGRADKIFWHTSIDSGRPQVYLSDGDGTFTASSSYTTTGASSGSSATVFSFADVNGDGRADKIYWNPGNYLGEPKVYFSESTGTFTGPVYSLRGTSQSADTHFYFTDISGDGKADQVRWNYSENSGELRNYFGK